MKTISSALALTAIFSLGQFELGQSQTVRISGSNGQGAGADQNVTLNYSRGSEKTYVGKVTGKISGNANNGNGSSMAILIKDKTGQHEVDLGPTWFISQQITKLNLGDSVKVIGIPTVINSSASDHEKVIFPRLIIKGHSVLALRDSQGEPFWTAFRRQQIANNNSSNLLSGTIVGNQSLNAENMLESGYQVQTPNGVVNVALGPSWYINQQNPGLNIGDHVVLTTTGSQVYASNSVALANTVMVDGGTLVLRPNGVPVWSGWLPYRGN